MGLPYGENFIILTSTIILWYTRLTDSAKHMLSRAKKQTYRRPVTSAVHTQHEYLAANPGVSLPQKKNLIWDWQRCNFLLSWGAYWRCSVSS